MSCLGALNSSRRPVDQFPGLTYDRFRADKLIVLMRAIVFTLVAIGVLGAGARTVFGQQTSLADVARQEQERRKTIRKPAKVITNSDLRSVPPVIPPPPAAEPAADGTKPASTDSSKTEAPRASGGDKPAEQAKDQSYWSGRVKALQTQLERDQTYAVALQSRINALTTQYVNQADPVQQAAVATDRQNAVNELNRLTKQIEDDKKAISDLQEEARRAGAPPGWLR
jgi:hypothetical protein